MTDGRDEHELISRAAAQYGVPTEVLTALLALEGAFENFSVFGKKAEFARQVARILDEGSGGAST